MKKITILGLIILGLGFSPLLTKADVIPENSHPLNRCVKVVNLDQFPEITLVGYYTGPMVEKYEAYQIKNDECLTKGYKFNSLSIYWTTKDKFSLLDLKNLPVKKGAEINHGSWVGQEPDAPTDLTLVTNNLEVFGGFVDNKNLLNKEEIQYSIVKSTDGKISLQKTKVISDYNNGTPSKIETFSSPKEIVKVENKKEIQNPNIENKVVKQETNNQINNNQTPIQPVKKSFWHRVACFFGLTRNC